MSNWKLHIKREFQKIVGLDLNYSPTVQLRNEHFGSDYGGWWVATEALNQNSIVYSFGIGTDLSFDLALIERFGLTVHAFDPTPRSLEWVKTQSLPPNLIVHPWGLGAKDGSLRLSPPEDAKHVSYFKAKPDKSKSQEEIEVPVFCLTSIAEQLNHTKIDVLKMDIEGSEYDAIPTILSSPVEIQQILVEFHHNIYESFPKGQTKSCIENLECAGYQIFKISPSNNEYHFIRVK